MRLMKDDSLGVFSRMGIDKCRKSEGRAVESEANSHRDDVQREIKIDKRRALRRWRGEVVQLDSGE